MSKKSTLFVVMAVLVLLSPINVRAQDSIAMPSVLNQKAYKSVRLSLWFSGLTGQAHPPKEQDPASESVIKHPDFLTDKHFLRLIK
ncbi:MAG: hypothetical protein JNM93_11470 [Bacteriovoracaceae bacterium]|nr:hypothetical protein [Bacteriovoracaceae bacterium]